MTVPIRLHLCHTCTEPLARASDRAEHVFRGHQVETLTLHCRQRGHGDRAETQYSTDWQRANTPAEALS